jgi:hypothetical protein
MKFKNVQKAIAHYVANNSFLQQVLDKRGFTEKNVDVSSLPDIYDDTPYDTIFNGNRYQTVGEYKQALEKFYRYRG